MLKLVVVFGGDTRVRTRKQSNVNYNYEGKSVIIQLENVNKENIGPELQIDATTNPNELKVIIKAVYEPLRIVKDTTKIQHIFEESDYEAYINKKNVKPKA